MTEEQDAKTEVSVSTSTNAAIEEPNIEELKVRLAKEQETVASYEKKLQYLLADFENLKKRTELDVKNRVNSMIDEIMLKFLSIYDDFVRAKEALTKQKVNTQGLDAILKNMNSFLAEYGVTSIDALGEIFNPKLHEAISVKEDPSLDNDTITAEIRKGYILQNRVIRPSLVEISKKSKND
ncbi:MAG: nucleotide exchange factor GrpE [Nitrososphaerota archaeon]